MLEDKTLKERYVMGSWHIFLPSEVCLGKNFEINIADLNQFHFDTLKHSLSKFCRVSRVRF